jgi:hypothetical protein
MVMAVIMTTMTVATMVMTMTVTTVIVEFEVVAVVPIVMMVVAVVVIAVIVKAVSIPAIAVVVGYALAPPVEIVARAYQSASTAVLGALFANGTTDLGVRADAGATPTRSPREAAAETAKRCINRM